ncbi:hypothetical protein K438DRAFT_1986948 [Mycena galopus ATCC 62051]|nr:hypothetical protein K438DRAFT_1986948 [Mycena galopus ATCC 62051]
MQRPSISTHTLARPSLVPSAASLVRIRIGIGIRIRVHYYHPHAIHRTTPTHAFSVRPPRATPPSCRHDLGKKDVDFTVAIPRFKLNENPRELAERVQNYMRARSYQLIDEYPVPDDRNPYIERTIVDGVFIHFLIRDQLLLRSVLDQVFPMSKSERKHPHGMYGMNATGQGKKVVIEFSSPNIAKPFHAGHLRSAIIGAFLSKIYVVNGWDITRINYLGDWGVQVGLLAIGFRRVLPQFNHGGYGERNTESWRRFHDLSIDAYKKVDYIGGSLVTNDNIESVMRELRDKGLLVEKQKWESDAKQDYTMPPPTDDVGNPIRDENPARALDLREFKLDIPVYNGTTIYLVRDIAGAILRPENYKFDKMIYVVGDQQDLHCAQLFKILELMWAPFASKLQHITFGKVKRMATRTGDVKFLEEILDMAKEAILVQMQTNVDKFNNGEDPEATSDQIGMTCVKIRDKQAKRINTYAFDTLRMISFEGDTGAYLQYAHARLCSLERKVAASQITLAQESSEVDTDLLLDEPHVREITYALAWYPEVVRMAFRVAEPSTIVTYCFRLSHTISSAWGTLIVQGQDPRIAGARLLVFVCVQLVLASGMRLLGLRPVERM